mmetsp:Transcript_28123/g.79850  ORF Transcript_28123/g.79850 Transcript_28123/m.79850 type:complete len:486 (-) Transcript_28123:102-1559(-)
MSRFVFAALLAGCLFSHALGAGDTCGDIAPSPLEALAAANNQTVVCEMGCWDMEDEACHQGLTQNQCAEIYGHVAWAAKCNCRTEDGTSLGEQEAAPREATEVNLYFSVPAFVVLFRESLEVTIVLVIIIQFLTKAKDDGTISEEMFKRLKREVYIGASAGFVCCLIIGVGFLALASLARGLFRCDGLLIFDGVIMSITSVVLTFLALNFYKMIYTKAAHELKMKRRVEETIVAVQEGQGEEASFGKKHAFLVFTFTTGLREGLESIIFLVGVISDFKDPSYVSSLPIPIITALILSRIVGCIFFQGTKRMRVEHFMRFCAAFLLFIAAGFFSQSMHKWQELDLFGTWSPIAERPWHNQRVFDATDCCNDKTNRFFVLMRALLGWQDQPTPIEFFAWFSYWVIALAIGFVMVRRAKRTIAAKIEKLRAEMGLSPEPAAKPESEEAKASGEVATAEPSESNAGTEGGSSNDQPAAVADGRAPERSV